MRRAAELCDAWADESGLSPALIADIFGDAPLDFSVHFARTLPLAAQLSGAVGITLFGRVHLLSSIFQWSAIERLLLLRHEAEHVRQQRVSPLLFYPRYIAGWLRGLTEPASEAGMYGKIPRTSALRNRLHRAYLAIPAEREAYAAERRARERLGAGS